MIYLFGIERVDDSDIIDFPELISREIDKVNEID